MATTIYVGNLPFESSEVDIEALFAPFGEVQSVRYVIDHTSSNGQCYAFVEMEEREAREATRMLNGLEFRGQTLVVNLEKNRRRSKRDRRHDRDAPKGRREGRPRKIEEWEFAEEQEEETELEDDGWWGDEEDTGWHGHRSWLSEGDDDES
jgi:RNA recognition motif-containing protein